MIRDYFLENLATLKGNLTQEELAEKLAMPRGRISSWISRKTIPSPEDIEALASFFNVEPYYFFMKPGSQGNISPSNRSDSFNAFLDRKAQEILNEVDIESYNYHGGASAFVQQMIDNYETPKIAVQDWYLKLAAEVAKYAGLDLVEKVRKLYRKD